MRIKPILLVVCAGAYTAGVAAQTVTVTKAGGGNFTSVSSAISSFTPDPDSSQPNVIRITDGEVYSEKITIDTPVTIEASSSSATLALLGNPLGTGGNGGIFINLPTTVTSGVVTLRNLNIIPDVSTSGTFLLTAIENGNNNVCLTLDKCILAPNFQNQPYVTNGWKNDVLRFIPTQPTYDPSIIQFGDDGIVLGGNAGGEFEGEGTELIFKDSVLTHFRRDYVDATKKPYGIVMENPYGEIAPFPNVRRITRVLGDSAVSFCETSMNLAGDVEINNMGAPRIQIRGAKDRSIEFTGPALNFRTVSGIIAEGAAYGIIDNGFGSVRPTIKDSILYTILNQLLWVRKFNTNATGAGQLVVEDSTICGGRTNTSSAHAYRLDTAVQTNVVFRNSIIAGRKDQPTNGTNVIWAGNTGSINISGSAIVTSGPYALRTAGAFSLGANVTIVGSASTTADPDFQTTVSSIQGYPSNPGLLNVASPAYASANEIGGPLGGGADYVGPTAAISDWAMYSAEAGVEAFTNRQYEYARDPKRKLGAH